MQCKVDGCGGKHKALGYCYKHYVRFKKYGSPDDRKWSQATLEIRFWNKVDKRSDDECWPWLGQLMQNGYGRISLGAKKLGGDGAHRVSWKLFNNQEIPEKMVVMHSCDNPKCVNPKHLSIGTSKQNTQDMINKGRRVIVAPVGNENGKAILNAEKVKLIRSSDESHAALARKLGVSPNCIRGVRIGRTWSHIN